LSRLIESALEAAPGFVRETETLDFSTFHGRARRRDAARGGDVPQ